MTFERFKARAKGIHDAFDEKGASLIEGQALKQESRMRTFFKVTGIFFVIAFFFCHFYTKNHTLAWLFFCTFYLQLMIVFYYKKLAGLSQWE